MDGYTGRKQFQWLQLPLPFRRKFSLATLLTCVAVLGSSVALYINFIRYRSAPFAIQGTRVWNASFCPDNKRILVSYSDSSFRVFDFEFNLLLVHKPSRTITWPEFSKDGTRIFFSQDQESHILDATTGDELFHCIGRFAGLAPNGKNFVTTEDVSLKLHIVHVWGNDGKEVSQFRGHTGYLHHNAAFSPDSTRVVSCSSAEACTWELSTGTCIATLKGENFDYDEPISFSPDGKHVLTGVGQAKVWNANTLNEEFSLYLRQVGAAFYSPSGEKIITYSRLSGVLIWNVSGDHENQRIGTYHRYNSIRKCDNRLLVNGCDCSYPEVYDVGAGKLGYFDTWSGVSILDATHDLKFLLSGQGEASLVYRIVESNAPDIWIRSANGTHWSRYRLASVRWAFYCTFLFTVCSLIAAIYSVRRDRKTIMR